MNRHLLSSFSVVSLVSALFVPAVAAAAEKDDAQKIPAPSSEEHLRGLELTLRPTIGSAGSESPLQSAGPGATAPQVPQPIRPGSSSYGSSIGAGLQLGFRFHPLVSAGLRGDLGAVSANSPNDGTTNLSRGWQSAGVYARVYPLALNESARRYIDPWLATGITYVHDGQTFDRPIQTTAGTQVNAAYHVDTHSIGIPIGIGVDYRVTRWLSAGPSFEYVIMNPIAGCAAATASGFQEQRVCTDSAAGKQGLVTPALGAWNAGLTLRVTPF